MIELTRTGARFCGADEDARRTREVFEREHCIRVRGMLEPVLLAHIQGRLERATFEESLHPNIGVELEARQDVTISLLHFLMNDPAVLAFVTRVTGCSPLRCFTGRVYRIVPGAGHYDSWHQDMVDGRRIGCSLNLSRQVFAGGLLQIREKSFKRLVHEVANTGFGDAILFRIAGSLEHRNTPVEGSVIKTAFAGWFCSEPDFPSFLTLDPVEAP